MHPVRTVRPPTGCPVPPGSPSARPAWIKLCGLRLFILASGPRRGCLPQVAVSPAAQKISVPANSQNKTKARFTLHLAGAAASLRTQQQGQRPGPAAGHQVPWQPAALYHLHRSHLQLQHDPSNSSQQRALASRPAASVVPLQNDAAAGLFGKMIARAQATTVSVVV